MLQILAKVHRSTYPEISYTQEEEVRLARLIVAQDDEMIMTAMAEGHPPPSLVEAAQRVRTRRHLYEWGPPIMDPLDEEAESRRDAQRDWEEDERNWGMEVDPQPQSPQEASSSSRASARQELIARAQREQVEASIAAADQRARKAAQQAPPWRPHRAKSVRAIGECPSGTLKNGARICG